MNKQDGYVLDSTYPAFFYKEMLPLWLKTVVDFLGFKSPEIKASFAYLELACATGTNLLMCALNHPQAHFVGVDFNQQHIDQAQSTAQKLGLTNIEFIHCDFATFLAQNKQHFDFIVNHGTFSWVSPLNQQHILNIVAQFLNESGIFYLHYMCYPGSIDLSVTQKLLNLVDQQAEVSSLHSMQMGKQLWQDLNAAGAFIHHANINAVMQSLNHHPEYLVHEFLSDYWQPLYSVDLHQRVFELTQMSYLGSANPCNNIDNISIPEKIQPIIQQTKSPALKEYLKDIARNAKQRIDIFQKKPQMLSPATYLTTLYSIKFKLLPHTSLMESMTFHTPIGEIEAAAEIILPVLACLAEKNSSTADLFTLAIFQQNATLLVETLFLLMQENYLYPVLQETSSIDDKKMVLFNQELKKYAMQLRRLNSSTAVIVALPSS